MSYPIEDKLVIAVASSALFELNEADALLCKDPPYSHGELEMKDKVFEDAHWQNS